jgi:hypothetical protein
MLLFKIIVVILPIGIKPDDLLFWFFFVLMLISLTFFKKTRVMLDEFIWLIMKFFLLTKGRKPKGKRGLNHLGEPVADWADELTNLDDLLNHEQEPSERNSNDY